MDEKETRRNTFQPANDPGEHSDKTGLADDEIVAKSRSKKDVIPMSKRINKTHLFPRVCWNCDLFIDFGVLCWDCVRAMLISAATVSGAWIAAWWWNR